MNFSDTELQVVYRYVHFIFEIYSKKRRWKYKQEAKFLRARMSGSSLFVPSQDDLTIISYCCVEAHKFLSLYYRETRVDKRHANYLRTEMTQLSLLIPKLRLCLRKMKKLSQKT